MATTYGFDVSISSAVSRARGQPTTTDGQAGAVVRPLAPTLLDQMERYWHAANYLTVAQIYLLDNPLLREPLRPEHIKPRLLGHWGTSPGLSLIYLHLNRLINERGANVIYLTGPGHGGPALVALAYLEGTYSMVYIVIDKQPQLQYFDLDHAIEHCRSGVYTIAGCSSQSRVDAHRVACVCSSSRWKCAGRWRPSTAGSLCSRT